jgi:hypothetical protein
MSGCEHPEGNGVSLGRGAKWGPGPPSEGQDKQLICNSGGDKTPMGEPGGEQDGSMQHQEPIKHRVCSIVN